MHAGALHLQHVNQQGACDDTWNIRASACLLHQNLLNNLKTIKDGENG
jgi:hypothetical protein